MKNGDKVWLYYDGKMGRSTTGKCTKVRGFAILVEFKGWSDKKNHECWFVISKDNRYYKKPWWKGYVRDVENSVHVHLGFPGDFYSVFSEDISKI